MNKWKVGIIALTLASAVANAENCKTMSVADEYVLPKEALDGRICAFQDEFKRNVKEAQDATKTFGSTSRAYDQANYRLKQLCRDAATHAEKAFSERFKSEPRCAVKGW